MAGAVMPIWHLQSRAQPGTPQLGFTHSRDESPTWPEVVQGQEGSQMRQLGIGGARDLHLHLHFDAESTWETFQYGCGFNITMRWVSPSQEL